MEKDFGKAMVLFRQAVDAENTCAMFNLALLLLDPEAGFYDRPRAVSLVKKCALADFAEARELLEVLHAGDLGRA